MTPEEGQILTGPQFSEPVRVETVRADGPGSWVLGDALHPDRHPSLKNRSTCSGTGESVETPMVSQMEDFTSSRAFRVAGPKAFAEAGITHNDVDHLMIYDAFAHLPDQWPRRSRFCVARRGRRFHRRA